jgi:hypothetical protein
MFWIMHAKHFKLNRFATSLRCRCHSETGANLTARNWIPACAGMTDFQLAM